jgi:hypothetical protein
MSMMVLSTSTTADLAQDEELMAIPEATTTSQGTRLTKRKALDESQHKAEILETRRKALEKARAVKAEKRKMDEEAKARGETPPSILQQASRSFPLVMDQESNIKRFGIKQAVWDTNIPVPLSQLLYHSPDLLSELLSSMGIPNPMRKISRGVHSIGMDTDIWDTSPSNLVPIGLATVTVLVNDYIVNFKIDPGAVVSVVSKHLVDLLGLQKQVTPVNEHLKYAGGQVELALGLITLSFYFSDTLQIRHSFMITDNPHVPLLLGLNFLVQTRCDLSIMDSLLVSHLPDRTEVVDIEVPLQSDNKEQASTKEVLTIAVVSTRNELDLSGFHINPALPNDRQKALHDVLLGHSGLFGDQIEEIQQIKAPPVYLELATGSRPRR